MRESVVLPLRPGRVTVCVELTKSNGKIKSEMAQSGTRGRTEKDLNRTFPSVQSAFNSEEEESNPSLKVERHSRLLCRFCKHFVFEANTVMTAGRRVNDQTSASRGVTDPAAVSRVSDVTERRQCRFNAG